MTRLVSILIPAYNAERTIAETIRSALGQTWTHSEVIVVDDGSADRTLEVAQRFASKQVLVLSQPNLGAAAARNAAYARCQGEYIQWLDADDLLAPDKIARQLEAAGDGEDTQVLLSSAWGRFMHRTNRAAFRPTPLWCDLDPVEWLVRKWEHNVFMPPASWLVSHALTEAAGPWDTRLLGDDDGEYFCRVVGQCCAIRFVPDARVFYRVSGPEGLSYIGRSNTKLDAQLLSMELQIGYLRSLDDSDRVRAACLDYVQAWLIHVYPQRPDLVSRAQQLAASVGGRLLAPRLSWKYAWMRALFGWRLTKRAQLRYNALKLRAQLLLDTALCRLDGGRSVR